MRRFLSGAFLIVLAAGSAVYPAVVSAKEEVTSTAVNDHTVEWRITEPVITQAVKNYRKIKFEAGDVITLEAGGCDQTGGFGATWKRYVDPQGPNADRLYHGLIRIPGATDSFKQSPTAGKGKMVRLLDLHLKNLSTGRFKGQLVVGDLSAVPEKDRYLRLGFEDDGYGDNGYWGRDNGTGDQCQGLGNAYVLITITHRVIRPLAAGKATAKDAEKTAAAPAKAK